MVMSMCCVGVFICGCVQQANSTVEVVDTSKEDNKVIVTDIEGRVVELAGPAKRVVDCTGLGGTRILIQLEAEGLVVGMTDHGYDALNANGPSSIVFHPTQAAAMDLDVSNISSIGGYNEPNVQSIMALEPDLILVGWGGKELADSLEAQTGIKAACIGRMDGRFDYDLYQIVGSLIGKEDRAQALIEYTKDKLSIVTDITDELSESDKKSVYLWLYPALSKTPRSNGVYDALDYAGAINVASTEDGARLYETSKEQIAKWQPDYIFLQSFCKERADGFHTEETLKNDPILQHLDAVKNNNVYKLKGPNADWDTAVELAEVFYTAKILYPERFTTLDVEVHGNEIFKMFYGIDGMYSEMQEYLDLKSFK